MRVILAEKPSVARDIAKALGCTTKEQGFFRGKDDLVTWAIGHLVRLAEPGDMNPAWGKPWRREALPMIPGEWTYLAEDRTADQFAVIQRLFNDKRVTQIVNATDAGREGEAIFRRIYDLTGSKKPVLRFWASSLTEDAIEAAFAKLRPASDYDALGAAAQARAQIDWLIGMNHSRATTLHNSLNCSVGRVQTPTLAMIVRRHHEITGFVKTFFYEVHADMGEFVARALNAAQKYDFDKKPEAEAILASIPAMTIATVTAMERKPRRTPPPQLHNLGELQKEANRRFGLTADRTLELAQSLYENHKAITYPRSSSRHLSEDMVGGLPAVLRALRLGPDKQVHVDAALARAKSGPKLSKRFVDGSKLSDHHAIIPTAKAAPGTLSADERKVYQIVAERFLCIFLPDKETEETRIDLAAGVPKQHPFRAKGSRLVAPGWTAVTGNFDPENKNEELEDRQELPLLKVGQQLPVQDSELVTKERKPPAKFNDATLLSAMETAGKQIDDEALREAMKGRGLGTEATRSAIIQKLIDLSYVERNGKAFDPTGKGIALIDQVLPKLASAELTGAMEEQLALVEAGKLDASVILSQVADELKKDIPAVFASKKMQAAAATPITAKEGELLCPKCKGGLLAKRPGQTFYGCSRFREGCGFTVNTVVAKKAITDAQVRDLVSPAKKYRTKVIKGFTSKAGKPFDALLFLNQANEWKVEFEFER
ncbi:DNA topoisomerase-3 [Granulicella rosea]|uniref:DNA topoisomerase n=1 Tax=Granulicella rosea TaxID=474952 RepID=A0A239DMM9_9BACT|nr:type IA DNA topoisomerase [Granulicella rosea]SNS32934.1 DNA topoisomerase-3 [Granulicella rosea]